MRSIGIVTTARSDYGIYLPLLKRIQGAADLRPRLMVSGTHLSQEFGMTVGEIERDGFRVDERIEMLLSSDTPQGIAKSMGLGLMGFAEAYARFRPDILLVLGDRFEMHGAALAALPFKIPVAHIHGGEVTMGAMDDALRHSITKLSHLHFVSTRSHARRVAQLGEEPWRITVSGAPSLDTLETLRPMDLPELSKQFDLDLARPPLLVTFHPVTLEYEQTRQQFGNLLHALETLEMPVVFTMPNADTSGRIVREMIEAFSATTPWARVVENFGTRGYFSMMAASAAMVGNSSSGIIEAASMGLPAVNIGNRQEGRTAGDNVIHCGYGSDAILAAVLKALSPGFRETAARRINPYGKGDASRRILNVLREVPLDERLVKKRFHDMEGGGE